MKTITNTAELVAGSWYAVGMENLAGAIEWGCAPIYKYEGDGCWSDDSGAPIETVWDSTLQMTVSISSADAYMPQNTGLAGSPEQADRKYTYEQIAGDYRLWVEYVDPHGAMRREDFDSMAIAQRVELQELAFGKCGARA